MSGGEQQRIANLRAIIDNPKVVLCDEPTASLDRENVKIFMYTLVKIKENTKATIIIVTHDEKVLKIGGIKFFIQDGCLESQKCNVNICFDQFLILMYNKRQIPYT